jgi:sortase A
MTIEMAPADLTVFDLHDDAEGAATSAGVAPSKAATRRAVGLTLVTLGLAFLLFVAYLFGFTSLQQQRRQRQLLNVFTTPAGAVPLSGAIPSQGKPVAVLEIPALHLDQVVVQGTTPQDTAAGPGVMPQTARLGTKGNAVIAGRRFTAGAPFAHLASLRPGDPIKVVSGLGVFHYRVVDAARIATTGGRSPASPTKAARLTLLTSSSMTGGDQLYVVAALTSAPAAARRPTSPPSTTELGIAGQPDQLLPTILWGIILIAALGASIAVYQRARRYVLVVYVLSTPIVLAVALLFYSHLYQLLPSTT